MYKKVIIARLSGYCKPVVKSGTSLPYARPRENEKKTRGYFSPILRRASANASQIVLNFNARMNIQKKPPLKIPFLLPSERGIEMYWPYQASTFTVPSFGAGVSLSRLSRNKLYCLVLTNTKFNRFLKQDRKTHSSGDYDQRPTNSCSTVGRGSCWR